MQLLTEGNTMNGRVVERAAASCGGSSEAVYKMVQTALGGRHSNGGTLLDVGCGQGRLRSYVSGFVNSYVGVDVLHYSGFPTEVPFIFMNLDSGMVPLPDDSAEVVVAVETIEHLENPRAFFRELRRLVKPQGLVIVTTPNQLSLLSKLTLLTKNQFNAFQEAPGLYPAHITALLESDLIRLAQEVGLTDIEIAYSQQGRLPFTARHWSYLPGRSGRRFSDNVVCSARAPGANR
jgi:SAM-dependent methyltransferase